MSELMTLIGETDGSSTTGTFSLNGDLLYEAVESIRIPKGQKVKLWCKRISGSVETDVLIKYTHDITTGSPTYITVSKEKLASAGEITLEKRRPIVLRGITGKEGFKVEWSQPTAGVASVEIDIEIGDE